MKKIQDLAGSTFGKQPTVNPDGESVELTDVSFPKLIEHGSWLVMFHAPWCHHCQQLKPIFEGIAPDLKHQVDIAKVDCTVNSETCHKFGISGFPSLKLQVFVSRLLIVMI